MAKNAMALAAVLLACGIGAVSAQGQMPQEQIKGQGSEPGQAAAPLYREQVPATVPLGAHVDKPKINPSAAGTLMEGEGRSTQRQVGESTGGHSGSVGVNANTHPLKSLKAGGEPREEGMTAPSGIHPTPGSTMNRDTGR